MPLNPNNKVFIHARKKTHVTLAMVCSKPGRWGIMTMARFNGWDHNDLTKVVNKLILKCLILLAKPSNKLFPTEKGREVLQDTNDRSNAQRQGSSLSD